MTALRVASYNLKDFTLDRPAAARVIRAIDPDVLCLQEVPRRLLGSWRVSSFAADCGLYWSGSHRGSGGTTVLTSLRVEAVQSSHHRLRVAALQRTRGYAVMRVRPAGHQPLVVASVHLSLDAGERERHAEQILRTLAGAAPLVVAGDLNEGDTGAAWQHFSGPLRLVSPPAPTFPARHPRRRLDVIFASPEVVVLPHRQVALAEEDLVAASDHRPTWVDITVPAVGRGRATGAGPATG